jgi:hypothetical protein
MSLSWLRPPDAWSLDGDALTIRAGARTDWFVDPAGGEPVSDAPALVGRPPDDDFMLRARVRIDSASTFDAGVLFVHGDERAWAKLCLERSPQGTPTIVSVVTRNVSDDCNSETVEDQVTWLRLAKLGPALAFHASDDGRSWRLVRYFSLPTREVAVGFEAQSPTGPGCTVTFDQIAYRAARLGDLRDGS